jgi:VWFA-related protein
MNLRRPLVLAAVILAAAFSIIAQDDDPIKVESTLVRLNVGVVDRKGRSVTDLDRASFEVFEDGQRQEITSFQPSSAPFSVVMLLDMSGSTLGFRPVIKQSASLFLDALSPGDRVAVVEFNDKVSLRNDFTANRKTVINSINVASGQGKTQLYKAIDFALDRLSKENSRRKAIIVLTDGVDTTVRDRDREALEKLPDESVAAALKPDTAEVLNRVLNRADTQGVTIYPLALPTGDPAKLADPTPRQVAMYTAARTRLQIMADRSGGSLNAINRLEEMGRIYAQVAAELRTLYTIEYQPTNDKRDGRWRAISLTVKNPYLISRTRPGYFAR